MSTSGYRLIRAAPEDNLAERFFGRFRRVGLDGVLADTNRLGTPAEVPGEAAEPGMAWQRSDQRTRRWYPQGITTSADASAPTSPDADEFAARPIVLTSWYAHGLLGHLLLGSRISVVDLSDPAVPRYRHVLLVAPKRRWGLHRLSPVRVHAGGIVWYGRHLYVAGGSRGIRVFRLDDLIRVRNRLRTRGYRYVLPQFTSYEARHAEDVGPMTYSFMSLDRSGDEDHLIAGEYGRKGGTHRLMRYALDRDRHLLRHDDHGSAVPARLYDRQIERMQGATLAGGTWFITSSMGKGVPGDLWVGHPGDYTRHRGVLPTGPEDIAYWPKRRQLWSLTEWPGRRWVYPIDADRWVARRRPDPGVDGLATAESSPPDDDPLPGG